MPIYYKGGKRIPKTEADRTFALEYRATALDLMIEMEDVARKIDHIFPPPRSRSIERILDRIENALDEAEEKIRIIQVTQIG